MKPAAPVTRMRTPSLYAARLQRLANLLSRALDRRRALEMRNGLATAPEADERRAQVVLGVGLVELARILEGGEGLPGEAFRAGVVAAIQRRGRVVCEQVRGARRRRRPGGRRRRRRWGRRRGWRRRRRGRRRR